MKIGRWWLWWLIAAAVVATVPPAPAAVLYLGLPNGSVQAFTTTGGAPPWARRAWADVPKSGYGAQPVLGDLDGDGDLDACVGESGGHVTMFENVGSDDSPAWQQRREWAPDVDVGALASPALGDLDRDGDVDLLIGGRDGVVVGFEQTAVGRWAERRDWRLDTFEREARPALGDVDGDHRLDLVVGTQGAGMLVWVNGTAFSRNPKWDLPQDVGGSLSPALADLDGDGRLDVLLADAYARSYAFRNTGDGWAAVPEWAPGDPGSGPLGIALAANELPRSPTPPVPEDGDSGDPDDPDDTGGGEGTGTAGDLTAHLVASTLGGPAPLRVRLDASGSSGPEGEPLSFTWDFGDGTVGSPPAPPVGDAEAIISGANARYNEAKRTRDAKQFSGAVDLYLTLALDLTPLTGVQVDGPVKQRGTRRIDRVARYYLQKLAHDLAAIYLYHALGLETCDRYQTSLQYARESAAHAKAGGWPDLPKWNGTNGLIKKAEAQLKKAGCSIPPAAALFAIAAEAPPATGPVVEHEYLNEGIYEARVTVHAGAASVSASLTLRVGEDVGTPPPSGPGGPSDNDADPLEGFGAQTPGGAGGRVITVGAPTEDALGDAFDAANGGHAIVVLPKDAVIAVRRPLPRLKGAFITVDGNGATLYGVRFPRNKSIVEVGGHDVIVKNLRLRNGGDNLRAQGKGAYDVVFSHVSSTGAADDGVSIGYGAHDVTLQYAFLAGNTRSIFIKYRGTTNVSVHHTWVMKQWVRGPLVASGLVDLRNVIVEDWTLWGARYESRSEGNVVNSLFTLGDNARSAGGKPHSALSFTTGGPMYTSGNAFEGWAQVGDVGEEARPRPVPPVTTYPLGEMRDRVHARAGCLPRDGVDQLYIDTVAGWDVTESRPLVLWSGE